MATWNDYEKIARRLDRIAKAFERIANALETANIIEADRKTEPQREECKNCKEGQEHDCYGCPFVEPKDEPQTEETEMERLERIDNELEDAWARIRELTDEPQTDCAWK